MTTICERRVPVTRRRQCEAIGVDASASHGSIEGACSFEDLTQQKDDRERGGRRIVAENGIQRDREAARSDRRKRTDEARPPNGASGTTVRVSRATRSPQMP